uniref:Lipocalin n=1 Tax=Rhipicephalus appendiculatus TaxID=34631 RepID=A0A131Z5L2_RHIAP
MTLLRLICAFYFCIVNAANGTIDEGKYSDPNEVYCYQDPNMMLRYNGTVRLFRTSSTWSPLRALCLKSKYICKNGTSYFRTAEYFTPTKVNGKWSMKGCSNLDNLNEAETEAKCTTPRHEGFRSAYNPFSGGGYVCVRNLFMLIFQLLVKRKNFTLQITPLLERTSQSHIIVKGFEQMPNLPSVFPKPLLGEEHKYPVLFADTRCLIIGHYGLVGTSFCMLFVTDEALRHPLRHCNFMLLSLCGTPAYNAYTYEHQHYRICNESDGHRA